MSDKDKDILSREKDILLSDEKIKEILSKQKNLALQSFKRIEDPSKIIPNNAIRKRNNK